MISYLPTEVTGDVPLEATTWRSLLAELIDDIARSGRGEEVARLREGFVLFARAPAALRESIAPMPLPETFASWLAADGCETAVLALLGDHAGYMVSRGGSGLHVATLVLPGSDIEHTADGATFALSLLAALAQALLMRADAEPCLVASTGGGLIH